MVKLLILKCREGKNIIEKRSLDFIGCYEYYITDEGEVYNSTINKLKNILPNRNNDNRPIRVSLKSKTYSVKKLMGMAFNLNPLNKKGSLECLDGDKTNLKLSNIIFKPFKIHPKVNTTYINKFKTCNITYEELMENIDYNYITGEFNIINNNRPILKSVNSHGYQLIYYYNKEGVRKKYWAHRLAWLYYYGRFPEGVIDHINHNPLDNRIENLREVLQVDNTRNCSLSKNNTSGFNGVYWDKSRNKWVAEIKINFKKKFIGRYVTKEEAIKARKLANIEYGFHENHGIKL